MMKKKWSVLTVRACWVAQAAIFVWFVFVCCIIWDLLDKSHIGTDDFSASWLGQNILTLFIPFLNLAPPLSVIFTGILIALPRGRLNKSIHRLASVIASVCIIVYPVLFGRWYFATVRMECAGDESPEIVAFANDMTLSKQVWWIP